MDAIDNMPVNARRMCGTDRIGFWQVICWIVLHVRDNVFMNKTMHERSLDNKVFLVTGAARRIGAAIVTCLHANGARVAIHYRGSAAAADALAAKLNDDRANSAATFQSDISDVGSMDAWMERVVAWGGRLDGLVNNASSFYPTPVGGITEQHWDELIGSNLKGPLFLAQAAAPLLREQHGAILNIVDIHSQRPLRDHSVYGSAKAGLAMLTRSLAKDLAPSIRVNGISPGAILWPGGRHE